MINLDYSQVAVANLHTQLKHGGDVLNPMLLRHMVLDSIRSINQKFSAKYGEMVICADGFDYWRKSVFPHYKAGRKKARDSSGIDWTAVFQVLKELRCELKENFPYRVLCIPHCEADDIIATLAKHFHEQEKILIVSGDHDFSQLQIYPNVEQYSPFKKVFLKSSDPKRDLYEHILQGDIGDGVPNFLSADNCFVDGIRQSSVRKVKLDVWLTQKPEEYCDETMLRNYKRNKQLVDLSQIPIEIENSILAAWEETHVTARNKIYPYLVKMKMKNLLECVHEF